jgi:pimeloyl-ACP methyl ester carboxylesterase
VSASTLALAVALLVVAAWAHYAFWSRFYRLRSTSDEVLFADTADGWRLAVGRRRARGVPRSPPVLLVHGIAANRSSFEFGLVRWSLSAALADAGFDCFSLDLRGHGGSRRARRGAPRRWTFDDYVRLDIPAALETIRAATGSGSVLWVGHSQGGLIGIAAASAFPERIAGLVSLGAPVFFDVQRPLRLLTRLGFVTAWLDRFLAHSLAPFAGHWHPPVSEVVWNTRNVTRPVYRRVLVNVVENISPGVIRQFTRWIATDTFASLDGAVDYRGAMAHCRQPALFVAAERDLIAPPATVEHAARIWGGEKAVVRIGVAGKASVDYGHSDLLFGRNAPDEVFPRLRDWLLAHSAPRGQVAEAARGATGGGGRTTP